MKVSYSQVSNSNKNTFDCEIFYQSNIKRRLHLNPEDCKDEQQRLKIATNNKKSKLLNSQGFSESAYQAQLKQHNCHVQ